MKKIICMLSCILLVITAVPLAGIVAVDTEKNTETNQPYLYCDPVATANGVSGDENDPEIEDEPGDAFGYLDIVSAWFYENPDEPGYLFISMKINEPNALRLKQTFAVWWTYKGVDYSAGLAVGYGLGAYWYQGIAGYGLGWFWEEHYTAIENYTYDLDTGIITLKVSKSLIGNPGHGDLLTNTNAISFQRFGFIGRLGFSRLFLDIMILFTFRNSVVDYAPDTGYGRNYTVLY